MRMHLLLSLSVAAVAGAALGGCGELLTEGTGDLAGIAGAGIAGAVTNSAAAGAAIGLGVRSVADIGLRYTERRVHGAGQDRIAEAAGALRPGEVGVWSIANDLPIETDSHGRLTVARAFGGPGFDCREIVFSVDDDSADPPARQFYTATVCHDGQAWKWATAEPSTARWGGLQ
jgi:hypothetical protein